MTRNLNSAIKDGDLDAVLEVSDARFGPLWVSIANRIIPSNAQRSADADDIKQETLAALHRKLTGEERQLKTSGDVRNWTAAVAKKQSLRAAEKAKRTRGPSSLSPASDLSLIHISEPTRPY